MGAKLCKNKVRDYIDRRLVKLMDDILEKDDSEVIRKNYDKNKDFLDFLKQFREDINSEKLDYETIETQQNWEEHVENHKYRHNEDDDKLDNYRDLDLGK